MQVHIIRELANNQPLVNDIIHNAEKEIESLIGTKVNLIIDVPTPPLLETEWQQLIATCCEIWETSFAKLRSHVRSNELTDMRKAVCYLLRNNYPQLTLKTVGNTLNQDHTTVINSVKKAAIHIECNDTAFMKIYNPVKHLLNEKVQG